LSYYKIENLYRNPDALTLPEKECYAMEKVDGTSSHLAFKDGTVRFYSGGSKFEVFKAIFDETKLRNSFLALEIPEIVIYGEAYGAKVQGLPHRYGNELRFVAFEVKAGNAWLDVPRAHGVVAFLGLEFVHYAKVPCTEEALNAERDKPSTQAVRNGMGEQLSEGIIIRPLTERYREDGTRCIWKHKQDRVREMKTPRSLDPDKNKVLEDARAIAEEFVVESRIHNARSNFLHGDWCIENTSKVIDYIVNDVIAECRGEFVDTKETRKALAKRAAKLFHQDLAKSHIL